ILEAQGAVNRQAAGEGAEIGDRLVRGVTQGEERGMRRNDAVGGSGRMRHQGWRDGRDEFIGEITEAVGPQGLHAVNLVSPSRTGGGRETPVAVAGRLQAVGDLRPDIERVIDPPAPWGPDI